MKKKEDCQCMCHRPAIDGVDYAMLHEDRCCEYEEIGIDRFVLTAPITQGMFSGMLLETDEARPFCTGDQAGLSLVYDVDPRFPVHRLYVELHPYVDKIIAARNKIASMNLQPHRITILKGEVQVHPDFPDHSICPYCYPEMQKMHRMQTMKKIDTAEWRHK